MVSAVRSLVFLAGMACGYQVCVLAQQPSQQLFNSRCAGCHGLDGRGGEHGPNIATEPKVQDLSDRDLLHILREGVPSAGMPAFASSLESAELHGLVEYVRILQGKGKAGPVTGDAAHGKTLFFGSARCATCHMMSGQGGFLAADLSNYGATHAADAIREAIIHPNKDRDPRHGTVVVVTRNGTKYKGIVRNEDNFSLQMQTQDGNFHFFEKSAVARIDHPAQSLMPSDYESQLGKKGIDDLVAYLVKASASQVPAPERKDDDEE